MSSGLELPLPPRVSAPGHPWRRRRGALLLTLLVWLGSGLFDAGMHAHSGTLAQEWWSCLVARTPPRIPATLAAPAPHPRVGAEPAVPVAVAGVPTSVVEAAAAPVVEPAPITNVAALVDSSPAAVYAGKAGYHDVTVAIVDSGTNSAHTGLGGTVVAGLDTVNPCGDGRTDASGHGTAVAGIIAAAEVGTAPGVRLLPVRTSLATGVQLRWANAAAIVWATNQGADVINLSNSSQSTSASRVERFAVRYATERGVVIVAAAGNDPYKPAGYPAAYPEVISVTAVDATGELSAFAARKGVIDVAAPGSRIRTLRAAGGHKVVSGTSFAAPFVTGIVVRMLAVNPDLSPQEVSELLRATAVPLPAATTLLAHDAFGAVDVDAALKAAGARADHLGAGRLPLDRLDPDAGHRRGVGAIAVTPPVGSTPLGGGLRP